MKTVCVITGGGSGMGCHCQINWRVIRLQDLHMDFLKSLLFGMQQNVHMNMEKKVFVSALADERNGYLAGVDVLVDGGSVIGKKFIK